MSEDKGGAIPCWKCGEYHDPHKDCQISGVQTMNKYVAWLSNFVRNTDEIDHLRNERNEWCRRCKLQTKEIERLRGVLMTDSQRSDLLSKEHYRDEIERLRGVFKSIEYAGTLHHAADIARTALGTDKIIANLLHDECDSECDDPCLIERRVRHEAADELRRLQALHLERTKSTHEALLAKDKEIKRLQGIIRSQALDKLALMDADLIGEDNG